MSKWFTLLFTLAALIMSNTAQAADGNVLDHKMKTLSGKEINLADYKGKVVMFVNVASKCGLTPQYKELEALHEKYSKDGLAVVGVPCNQFGGQEPGTAEEISEFCTTRYGVKFDMLEKVDVNGENAAPLYKELTAADAKPVGSGKISWNFEKFIVGKDGSVVARFRSNASPLVQSYHSQPRPHRSGLCRLIRSQRRRCQPLC
jgi:glutathione peroxidase